MLRIEQRLKAARLRQGKTPEQIAAQTGISIAAYCDLEDSDDLYNAISISEVHRVCQSLGISMVDLYAEDAAPARRLGISWATLGSELQRHLSETGMTLQEFDEAVGWDLVPFVDNSDEAWDWTVDCLRDVCGGLGLNWLEFLPSGTAQ